MERLTLLLNHVIGREPVAMGRLKPHSGKRLRVDLAGWPGWMPPAPPLRFTITPAGLLEWASPTPGAGAAEVDSTERAADELVARIDASRPDQLALAALQGRRPSVQVEGDAALAADVNWLAEHLRWDIADDLERLVGPVAAQTLAGVGQAVMAAVSRLAAVRSPA